MVLLITGATGGLGRAVLETLDALQIPKESYMASTTSLARLPADLSNSVSHRSHSPVHRCSNNGGERE